MILTPATADYQGRPCRGALYLRAPPKCATTATEGALLALPGASQDGGHSMAWRVRPEARAGRLVWATTIAPLDWYRRVYLHAIDVSADGAATFDGLRAYGGGSIAWPAVLHGMTHPWEVRTPEQAGLIFRAPTLAVAALAHGREGLWSWAHRLWCGAACPSPSDLAGLGGPPVAWGADALVDAAQLEAGIAEVMGEPIAVPRSNERRADLREWLAAWSAGDVDPGTDAGVMGEIGMPWTGPRSGGPTWWAPRSVGRPDAHPR